MKETDSINNTNATNTIKKSNQQDLTDSLELFGEDANSVDVNSEFECEVNIPKDTVDNILKISRMIRVAVLTISGYEEQPSSNKNSTKYKLVKHPLASSQVIKAFESLLKPYSDESNMVSNKTWDSFKIQAMSDWGAFYKFCLREKASPDINLRNVYRVFQGCLTNVGEITCDNPHNMGKLFGTINSDNEDNVTGNEFK